MSSERHKRTPRRNGVASATEAKEMITLCPCGGDGGSVVACLQYRHHIRGIDESCTVQVVWAVQDSRNCSCRHTATQLQLSALPLGSELEAGAAVGRLAGHGSPDVRHILPFARLHPGAFHQLAVNVVGPQRLSASYIKLTSHQQKEQNPQWALSEAENAL